MMTHRHYAKTITALTTTAAVGLCCPFATAASHKPQVSLEASALIQRVLPGHADSFSVEEIPSADGKDVFEVESASGKVVLRGNTPVSAASALNWYLKNIAQCDISWCGDQLALPKTLPAVPAKVRVVCPHSRRVYFNYCTLSYTAAWWDWARWEREIDFMALNGINMPLAPVGLEGVWYETLLKFNFTDAEARAFLAGPCFQAWQWMTNIEGHGGPLPKAWIDEHIALGRRILERERELGMTPIQQGFSGYVPALLKKKFPQAAIAQQPSWCGFPGSHQLDPLDPLFAKLSRTFLETEIRLFGTSHVYATDPFHESQPPKKDKEYLNAVGKAIIGSMLEVDSQATWAMQAWSIRQDIVTAVPKDHLLVLDLAGNRRDFWGYPYIIGQLHNFGGRINLHGDLAQVATNPFAAAAQKSSLVAGTGLFMEATTQNPVFYNLYFDMIWRDQGVNGKDWLAGYARRRYGADSESARAAWLKLLEGPYRKGTSGVEYSSIIAARPALNAKKSGPNAGLKIPYDPSLLVSAWELLLKDADKLQASDGYRFDTVDVGRQVLSNLGHVLHRRAAAAFQAKEAKAFATDSQRFLELLSDVDALCSTRNEYHFGKWIADARRRGTTETEKNLYERDAAMLVTLWGPEQKPQIFDYSWREWGGLISGYYRERWRKFYDHLADCLTRGEDYSEKGLPMVYDRETFRANDFYSKLADWEIQWVSSHHTLPEAATGDSVQISKRLLAKYRPLLAEVYAKPTKPTDKNGLLEAAPAPKETTNIVYILADDLGYGDVHCLNPQRGKVATPNLDRLAGQGMCFTEAHGSSAVCTPTRYGIMTGRYNWRSRLQHGVLEGYGNPLIEADRLTVSALLRQHGYATACIGKWHLGMGISKKKPASLVSDGPTMRGFDYYFGISASLDMPPFAFIENNRFTEAPTAVKQWGRKGAAAPGFEAVNVLPTLTQKAVEYIGRQAKADHPFFLYLPLTSPHTPIVPTKAWQGKSGLGAYGDFVMETDWAVGEVMAALERNGMDGNTLVVFTSDNGCSPAAGVPALEKQGHFPSETRRGYKADIYDGGHRIPFIARWPGKIKAGTTNDQPICLTDLMATCADLLGAKLPDNAGEDSVSILPALLGQSDKPLREAIVHHSIDGNFAIRQGQWKLELCPGSGGWSEPKSGSPKAKGLPAVQLYDMTRDVAEQTNLQAQHPEIVDRLTKLLERYVTDGRSTPGTPQKNDGTINLHSATSATGLRTSPASITAPSPQTDPEALGRLASTHQENLAARPDSRDNFHVFLLMGQSNMAGYGQLESGDERPVEGITYLPTLASTSIAWQPARHPLHNRLSSDRFGLGLPFAIEYQKSHPGVKVGLIPVAWGGAPIDNLKKGTPVYNDIIKKAAFAKTSGVFKGVLWHQGESDTTTPDLANSYATKLDTLVADLRRDLGAPDLPFVAGDLADFYGTSSEHNAPDRVARIKQVRAVLRGLPQRMSHTAFVESSGLKSIDGHNVHFDRASYIELGRRYANAMQGFDASSRAGRFTVMSFNILEAGNDASYVGFPNSMFGGARRDDIANVIRECGADIVGVQECGPVEPLLKELGADWHGFGTGKSKYAGAILSRFPIKPLVTEDFLTTARVVLPDGTDLVVVNTHWWPPKDSGATLIQQRLKAGNIPDDPARFETEILAASDASAGARGYLHTVETLRPHLAAGTPVILTGDFNESSHLDWTERAAKTGMDRWVKNPTGRPLRFKMTWKGSTLLADAGMQDAYRAIFPDEVAKPGITWTPPYDASSPGRTPYGEQLLERLDRIYFKGKDLKLLEAAIVGESHETSEVTHTGPWVSDHRATRATFLINKSHHEN